MSQIIDMSNKDTTADKATEGIVKIIEAAAKAKQSHLDLEKQLMLDQITRQRNNQDNQTQLDQKYGMEQRKTNDENSYLEKILGPSQQTQQPGYAGQVQAQQQQMQAPPTYDRTANINGKEFPLPPHQMPQMGNNVQAQQPMQEVTWNGTKLPNAYQVATAMRQAGEKPNVAKLQIYKGLYEAAQQGNGNEEGMNTMLGMLGVDHKKENSASILPGIDTTNMSPDQIQQELQAKNPAHYELLKGIKDGKIEVSGRASKEIMKNMEEVQALWPGTDMTMVKNRIKTRNDFMSGKESQNIKALNTAIGHLDSLNNIIPALHNTDSSMWNAVVQKSSNATGIGLNPAIRRFQFTKNALSGELATVFKNTGGTDTEIRNISNAIGEADSPKNLQAVVTTAVDLLNSRLEAIQSKWQNTFFFQDDEPFPVLNQKSQDIVDRLGAYGQTNNSRESSSNFQEGQTATNPSTGEKITYKGGKWQ